jgi:uncharacterized alkaline shock family protein YloU
MREIKQTMADKNSDDSIGGEVRLDESVVARIAAMAVKNVDGLYSLGKSRLLNFGDDATRGVGVEVGKKQVALDLEVVIEYGHDIKKVARTIRQSIAEAIESMAGRQVAECNIHVVDIKLPDDAKPEKKGRVE